MARNAHRSSGRDEVRPLLGRSDSDDNDDTGSRSTTDATASNWVPATTTITTSTATATTSNPTTATASATKASVGQGATALDEHALVSKQLARHKAIAASWQKPLQLRTPAHAKSAKYVTWSWRLLRRKQFLALLLAALFLLYLNAVRSGDDADERIPVLHYSHVPGMKGYLVWSDLCKMPNIDPYQPEVMKFFKREKYKPCSNKQPLTRVQFNETALQYELLFDSQYVKSYSKSGKLDCCYQSVNRTGEGVNADMKFSLSDCIRFEKQIALPSLTESVLVSCYVNKKPVYKNGHPLIPERPEIRDRLDRWRRKDAAQQREQPPSVLMIGIDSISRVNLIRAMPMTAQYLYDNEWFEMSGYNKIDDNTFPNIMAVLTGRNRSNAMQHCSPTVVGGLDKCDFVWNTFREHGYVTGYGEDEATINTFNYLKMGFVKPPVDYYMRPFLLAAEKMLRVQKKSSLIYCLGLKHTAEFVYDYAIELAMRFKQHPFFGLFWTNTFSHNKLSDCTAMDQKMVDYLVRLAALGILDRTIIVFFSDHGIRFGPTRKTLSGHFEERLPFMFLWLPQHLKQRHPQFVNALSINKNRLTNPYDLHMTLKHLLALTGRVDHKARLAPAEDCPRCQTLLEPVPHNRSCDDIAIEDHWCTCIPYQSIYRNTKTVHSLARSAIDHINHYVSHFRNGTYAQLCRTLQLGSVESAYRAQPLVPNSLDIYRLIFYTKPNKGLFEATVRHNASSGVVEVTGEISRLDRYSEDSACVEDNGAKKYCSCG